MIYGTSTYRVSKMPPVALGLVPNGKRSVKPVPKDLLALVPKPKNKTIEVKANGTDPESDTVPFIKKKIRRTVNQVQQLAPKLKGSSTIDTVRNDWNFIFDHIQYVQDPSNIEAVRDPARTIHDGKGDCDCFTVCLGALLQAQRIPFKIRIAAYDNPGEWSHVYIVVPDKGKEIIVDPVLHKFNQEAEHVDKKDFDMKLVSLEGPGEASSAPACVNNTDLSKKLIRYIDTEQVIQWGYVPTQQFLEENNIAYHQQAGTETESGKFVINTPGGEMQIPTIIDADLANKIKALMASAGDKAKEAASMLQSKFQWWWLLVGAGVLWLLFGDKKKAATNAATGGALSGVPALSGKKKSKPAKRSRKLEVLPL